MALENRQTAKGSPLRRAIRALGDALSTVIVKEAAGPISKTGGATSPEGSGLVATTPTVGKVEAVVGAGVLASPMTGEAIPMTEAPDPLFAALALGDGAVVLPTEGAVYSPASGSVEMLCDTKHAVSIVTDDGIEVLIHIGVDTVRLEGAPFVVHVAPGDHVEVGQLLIEADLAAIEAAGKPTATMVIVTNTDDFAAVVPCIGAVRAGERLATVSK